MYGLLNEHAFAVRHRVIDLLRNEYEMGNAPTLAEDDVHLVLEELALLQLIAQAADNSAHFPTPGVEPAPPVAHLRNALRRWKE